MLRKRVLSSSRVEHPNPGSIGVSDIRQAPPRPESQACVCHRFGDAPVLSQQFMEPSQWARQVEQRAAGEAPARL